MVNENTIHFEAHVDVDNMMLSDIEKIYLKIEYILKEHYEISHITIKAEVNKCKDKSLIRQ